MITAQLPVTSSHFNGYLLHGPRDSWESFKSSFKLQLHTISEDHLGNLILQEDRDRTYKRSTSDSISPQARQCLQPNPHVKCVGKKGTFVHNANKTLVATTPTTKKGTIVLATTTTSKHTIQVRRNDQLILTAPYKHGLFRTILRVRPTVDPHYANNHVQELLSPERYTSLSIKTRQGCVHPCIAQNTWPC